jgi:gliding motility-associated-like protein
MDAKYVCLLLFTCLLARQPVKAQTPCSTLGQTPQTAFPVCGTNIFNQQQVPTCGGNLLVQPPACIGDGHSYTDKNPFWYKFTCFQGGTLGFMITPFDPIDDFDWQLFDVTGRDPGDVFTVDATFVSCNWSGDFSTTGITGAGPTGTMPSVCGTDAPVPGQPLPPVRPHISSMPTLILGHNYLLMISNFTNSNKGYALTFAGGTAVITDPTPPALVAARYSCETKRISVKLVKKMKCNSLATNGSDFTLNTPGISILSAEGVNCSNGFDMDSVVLTLNKLLPPGDYEVTMRNGTDNNTILDNCNNGVPVGQHVDFKVLAPTPVFIDSLVTLHCAPNQVQVVFTQPIDCNTIAANGSDFTITGPSGVTITGAQGNCINNNASNIITLNLSKRITVGGTYTVNIVTGSDGNSLSTECGAYILAGNNKINFTLAQQFPALLKTVLPVSCRTQKIRMALSQPVQCSSIATDGSDFTITGPTAVTITGIAFSCTNSLADSIDFSFAQPILLAGNYTIAVKRGIDGNTLITPCWQETPVGNSLLFATKDTVSAKFTYDLLLHCDYDTVALKHDGKHGVNSWRWFYDGTDSSKKQNPLKIYTKFGIKNISLIVSNGTCSDTAAEQINLVNVLEADFSVRSDTLCPDDVAVFTNHSTGNIVASFWDFGNGFTSRAYTPPTQRYPLPVTRQRMHQVRLIVQSNVNCFDTATHMIRVLNSCYVAVPTAFTPNGDGLNDYLYPLNGFKTIEMHFKVYNRLGQLVFETRNWNIKWDGRFKGDPQPPGTFVWEFNYTDRDSGRKFYQKGTSVLIR